jgi:hypothetical protein
VYQLAAKLVRAAEGEETPRGAAAAVLRELAASHTVDAGTWWEQSDPIPVYKLIEVADEIEQS